MKEMVKADEYLKSLHELRTLVFIECEGKECEFGEGYHFHQVGLTSRQFKKVSDAIILRTRKDDGLKEGYDMCEIRYTGGLVASTPFEGMTTTIDE